MDKESVQQIPVYIYALTSSGSRIIHYVGQTTNPKTRLLAHRCDPRKRRLLGGKPKMRILRTVPFSDAHRIETQIIKACRRKGQCKLNRQKAWCEKDPECYRPYSPGISVQCINTGRRFASYAEAERACDILHGRLYGILKGEKCFFAWPHVLRKNG